MLGVTADGKKIVYQTASGPSSYSTSTGATVTLNDVERIDGVIFAHIDGGYKIGSISTSGNVVTLHIYYYDYDASADGAAVEVAAGTDLSARTITVVAVGT